MRTVAILLALIVILGADPVQAHFPGDDLASVDDLLTFLRKLEGQVEQILTWMGGLSGYSDLSQQLPVSVLDRAYSAQVLAHRIEDLAKDLPRRIQLILNGLADRLRTIPPPSALTPRWIIEQVINASPQGDTAQQVRTLDELSEQNAAALGAAFSATETARMATEQIVEDPSPQLNSQAALFAARDLALRARGTPSTRAAMELLIEAVAAQIDQGSRAATSVITRQTASVQQQTLLNQQVATAVDRLAAIVALENAHQEEQLAQRFAAAAGIVESQRQTFADITQILLALNPVHRQRAMDRFFEVLSGGP